MQEVRCRAALPISFDIEMTTLIAQFFSHEFMTSITDVAFSELNAWEFLQSSFLLAILFQDVLYYPSFPQ